MEPCTGKIDEVSMKQYTEQYMCKNSVLAGKKPALEDSFLSLLESQLALPKKLALQQNPFPLLSFRTLANSDDFCNMFPMAKPDDIHQINDAQLDMAIADFLIATILQTVLLNLLGSQVLVKPSTTCYK